MRGLGDASGNYPGMGWIADLALGSRLLPHDLSAARHLPPHCLRGLVWDRAVSLLAAGRDWFHIVMKLKAAQRPCLITPAPIKRN